MLTKRLTKSGFDFIQWIIDPSYKPKIKQPPQLNELISTGIQRGYNYFYDNFDRIMDILFTMRAFRKTRVGQVDYLYNLVKLNRNLIFADYLPLPNKSLLIVEKSSHGTYIDPSIIGVIDAIEMATGIDHESKNYSQRTKEVRTVKVLYRLMNFYSNFFKNQLAKKEGILRKHVFATRSHFSFRAVIISITKPHRYNEIHIPWHIGLTVLKVHILNKLMKLGFEYNKAVGYIYSKIKCYDPLLDQILNELIEESPNSEGIACSLLRNPSLLQGSIHSARITKVKTSVADPTISLSILVVKGLNADFDGDALSCALDIDNNITTMMKPLEYHNNAFVMDKPWVVSDNVAIPKTVVATIANWLYIPDPVNEITLAKSNQLPWIAE
jgi:hypothetical protein